MYYGDIIESFEKALSRLKEALYAQKTVLTRDAAIKRFEFTFELAWKSIQKFLADQGIVCGSPKGCFKEAFKFGLIKDNPLWIRMIEDRNMTVHTYNELIAEAIYEKLRDYLPLFDELSEKLEIGD